MRVSARHGLGSAVSGGRGRSELGRRDGLTRWRKREKSEGRVGEVKSVRRAELAMGRNEK